jgi:hypothetical protein
VNCKAGVVGMAAILAIGLGAAPAHAGGKKGHDDKKDFVLGAGTNGGQPDNHFAVGAASDSDGSDARGHFGFLDLTQGPPFAAFAGNIKCLRVQGNRATAVGQITRDNFNRGIVGRYILLRFEDNGRPRYGRSQDHYFNKVQPAGIPQPPCPPPMDLTPEEGHPITSGDIVVHDDD